MAAAAAASNGDAAAEAGAAHTAEDDQMAREFSWLLKEEVPVTFMRIGRVLTDCLARLASGQTSACHPAVALPPRPEAMGADEREVEDDDGGKESRRKRVARALLQRAVPPPLTKVLPETDDGRSAGKTEAIRLAEEHTERTVGAVRLTDTSITMLKLAWPIARHGKGAAINIESHLHEDVSLSVEQLRSTINKLRLSLAEINAAVHQPSVRGPQHYAKTMQGLLDHCAAAKEALTTRISHYCEVTVLRKEMFSPPLSRDVLMDVFVDHGDICVEVAVLAEPASPGASQRDGGYTPRRVGSVFQDETGRWCEVASVHRSFGVVPCFSEVLKDLTLLVEHAQKMQDKLSIFQRRV